MKKLSILLIPFFLVACGNNSSFVIRTKHQVVMPEESMFNCPTIEQFPEPKTLTDIQVARLIVQLYQNNVQCKNSITSIKSFLEAAKETATKE